MESHAKSLLRTTKNSLLYTPIQAQVRSATSNQPFGPTSTQMQEIAKLTFNTNEMCEVMDMIDKRLNDSGKNWRHVYKALTLLDYVLHSGGDQVEQWVQQNVYIIKTLREFQYIDEQGKDQGVNVREKAKALSNLLSAPGKLAQQRKTRSQMHDRMGDSYGTNAAPYSHNDRVSSSYGGSSSARSPHNFEEDKEMNEALELSKQAYEAEERRRKAREETEFQNALAASQSSLPSNSAQRPGQQEYGHTQDRNSNKSPNLMLLDDDAFGFNNPPQDSYNNSARAPMTNPFHNTNQDSQSFANSYQTNPQDAFSHSQPSIQNQYQNNQPNDRNYDAFNVLSMSNNGYQAMGPNSSASAAASQPSNPFGQNFNTANQPYQVPYNDPNFMMAGIARNSTQIDPFAQMAHKPGTNPFMKDPFPPLQQSFDIQPMKPNTPSSSTSQFTSNQMDPFASLAVNNTRMQSSGQPEQRKTLNDLAKEQRFQSASAPMLPNQSYGMGATPTLGSIPPQNSFAANLDPFGIETNRPSQNTSPPNRTTPQAADILYPMRNYTQ